MTVANQELEQLLDAAVVCLERLHYMYKYNSISLDDVIKCSKIKIEFLKKNVDSIKYINRKNKIYNILYKYEKILEG